MDEIAEALKKQREAQGLSIDDLFQRTRINPDFLRAIESAQFDVLPDTYVKLFIKKYAQEVGLNVEEILAQYDRYAPKPAPPVPPPAPVHHTSNLRPVILIALVIVVAGVLIWQISRQSTPNTAAPLDATLSVPEQIPVPKPPITQQTPPPQTLPEQPISNQTTVTETPTETSEPQPQSVQPNALTQPETSTSATEDLSETIEAATSLSNTPDTTQTREPALADEIQPETPPSETNPVLEPEQMESNQETPLPTAPATQSETITMALPTTIAPENPIIVSGIAQETTQLIVTADGRTLFEGVLQAGSRPRWIARDNFDITLSNRNAINLSVQSQPLQFAPALQQAVRVRIDRSQISISPTEQ